MRNRAINDKLPDNPGSNAKDKIQAGSNINSTGNASFKGDNMTSPITNKDKALLGKYDFNQLEYTTVKQINEELELLKKWSSSLDKNLKTDADNIIDIRLKELKYLAACRYTLITNEIYNGYIALEKYFEDISKYSI